MSNRGFLVSFILFMNLISSYFLLTSCASLGFAYDESRLKQTASFDAKCPVDKISVLRAADNGSAGTGRFLLDVCGKPKKYTRMGMSYYESERKWFNE